MNGHILEGNPDALHGWQHDLHGASHHVPEDASLNAEQMGDVQIDLQMNDNVDD